MDKEKNLKIFEDNLDGFCDRYKAWREIKFSDIKDFDCNNYIFWTHSVRIRTQEPEFYSINSSLKSTGTFYNGTENFDIAFNPFTLEQKKRVSLALSTSNDHYTYGRIGYIVKAPIENMIVTGQASWHESNEELRNHRLLSPNELIKNDIFHEAVFDGKTIYGSLEPVSIFINLTNANQMEIEKTLLELEQIKMATGNIFPILDLSSLEYRLGANSKKI